LPLAAKLTDTKRSATGLTALWQELMTAGMQDKNAHKNTKIGITRPMIVLHLWPCWG